VIRTGKALWFASHAEVITRYPAMVAARLVPGHEALAVLPMTVESRRIGTLAIHFPEERTFSPEEQALMLTLAGLCAQALERARLYAAEATARGNAEQAVERTTRLQLVTAALAKAVTPEQVTAVVVEHGVAASGAAAGSVTLLDRTAAMLKVERAAGYAEAALRAFGTIPLDSPTPVAEAVRTGEPVWVDSAADMANRFPLVAAAHNLLGHGAAAVVPIALAGETAGALALSFAGPRVLDPQEKALILALAQQCAQALERARLYVEAQDHAAVLEQRVHERTEQLRALTARLESMREDERARIAREVHDELGGAMTAIKMDLSRLSRRGPGAEGELAEGELAEALAGTMQLIDDTIQTVRRIATDLRPALLDDFGLVAAVEWQLQEFGRRTGIKCQAEIEMDELTLEPQTATALFRVMQETLTNVARHAKATRVTVRLARQPGCLVMSLRDNGEGFQPEDLARKHSLGLAGMRERVFAVAGELTIQSAPGKGTIVTVTVPAVEAETRGP
jgi:signal transduction histidine kinase